MRGIIRVFAGFLLGLGSLSVVLGLFALIADPSGSKTADAQILGALFGLLVLGSILWMLTDIAEALHPKPPTPNRSAAAESSLAAIKEKLISRNLQAGG
jgi:hypothetical protein